MKLSVIDHDKGNAKVAGSKAKAETMKETAEEFGSENVEIVEGEYRTYGEYEKKDEPEPEPIEEAPQSDGGVQKTGQVPQNPDVSEDPVDWMPSHFVDTIQGVPTVNRKGYAVISSQYDVSVVAEPVVRASETDFEYAEFKAIATVDGKEYSGFGSAHIDRMDGDDPYLLNELAETRAMKRATAWATGVGMTAASEMQNSL